MPVFDLYTNGIIQYLLFYTWFLSLNFVKFIHIVACHYTTFTMLLYNIPLCEYAIMYLSILLLMNIWIVSSLTLLWILLRLIFQYLFFYEHVYAFLLSIYLGEILLGPRVNVCSSLVDKVKLFPKWLYQFIPPPAVCSTALTTLGINQSFSFLPFCWVCFLL